MASTIPKPAHLRQRTNRVSGAATLSDATGRVRVPPLPPEREWLPETRTWWRDVWRSPMVGEYIASVDRHGLLVLADLIDRYWSPATTTSQSVTLAAEIRQQGMRFGLSPIDRRRLQWEVQRVTPAAPPPPAEPSAPADDPRRALTAV